jgi:hypothetical protein
MRDDLELMASMKSMGPDDANEFITHQMYEEFLPTLATLRANNPPPGSPLRGYELGRAIWAWKSSIANEIYMGRV